MSRRIALPGADELFRSTGDGRGVEEALPEPLGRPSQEPTVTVPAGPALRVADPEEALEEASSSVRTVTRRRARAVSDRRPSGRERHDEKITVYVSPEELMDLEHARLALRGAPVPARGPTSMTGFVPRHESRYGAC